MAAFIGEGDKPAGFGIERDAETGGVRLSFERDNEFARILMGQDQLQAFVAMCVQKIDSNQLTSISKNAVRPGAMIAVKGYQLARLPNGSLDLTLLAVVDDRQVTIPWEISRDMVAGLIADLTKTLT